MWIARTNGNISGEPYEVRQGTLEDIHLDERANWRQVTEIAPSFHPDKQQRGPRRFRITSDGDVVMEYQILDVSLPFVRKKLYDAAAQKRWDVLRQGVVIGGYKVSTDDSSLVKILGALKALEMGAFETVRWKAVSGWVTLDLAAMQAIFVGVSQFVQACYDAEEAIGAEIEAGTLTSVAAINNHELWPA